ncbi:MAG: PmoA family protein [Flavobacteriaceae bacterium]|nr:PmoA family protein [Flavobacteriaceae bacterium]MCY4215986.1 PmoA family protein [Flavobacteriaceae bacterium]MCY4253226.1 PmoA family protein [Flavobacteriaceae bacterium]
MARVLEYYFLTFLIVLSSCNKKDDELLIFRIEHPSTMALSMPVKIDVNDIYFENFDKNVMLVKNKENDEGEVKVDFQIDSLNGKNLWFIHSLSESKSNDWIYSLKKKNAFPVTKNLKYLKKDGDLTIFQDGKPIINYRYGMTYPSEGVDSLFKKSGYVHPLWSPSGDTLTRIQPIDHPHHYGIWGPWTKTKINDRNVDFWNLGEGEGTVEFEKFNSIVSGPVYTTMESRQNHIDFQALEENRIAIIENLKIQVWNLSDTSNQYLIDYSSAIKTPLDSGIVLEAYRYGGGISFRATKKWNTDNSAIITSERKNRYSADNSEARWCIVSGSSSSAQGSSGILFMSHPNNRAHPEPIRVWPPDWYDGISNMFFQFSPIKNNDWVIVKDKVHLLKYRMLIFDGKMTEKMAEAAWKAFACDPIIELL